jgi:quinol monooxygenase YgiN
MPKPNVPIVPSLVYLLLTRRGRAASWQIGAADEPNPIVAKVKSELKDPSKPFTLIVQLQAKEGMEAKLEAAFVKAVKESRKEKGCLVYDLNRDIKEPTHFVVYERWKSLADLEAHLKSPHITALLKELTGGLLAAPPEAKTLLPAGE